MKLKHHPAVRALHWIMAILVLGVFCVIYYRSGMEDGDVRIFWLDVHRLIGLSILTAVALRVVVRMVFGHDNVPSASLAPWIRFGAGTMHVALYATLFAMPVLGWMLSSAKARHFKLFGETLPSLTGKNPEFADRLAEWHELGAWIFLALLGAHVAGALYHRFIEKDDVLQSMF